MDESGAAMVMTPQALRAHLQGVIAFPVTPFDPDLALDVEGLRSNVRFIAAHGVTAIVAAGGTGELYSLARSEYGTVVRTIVEAAGNIPVIAGVGFNAPLAEALAQDASAAGAAGILAFPPYYPHADEDGLFEHYRRIAHATPAGLLIYSRDWFNPGPAFVQRLAELPTLIAWKDGQGDIRRLQFLQAAIGERLLWVGGAGDDMVPAYYSTGIRAFTSSIANIAPALAVRLHEAAAAGDSAGLAAVMRLVVPLYAMRARRRGYEVSVMKAMMDILGLRGGRVRPPLPDVTAHELEELRALTAEWPPPITVPAPARRLG